MSREMTIVYTKLKMKNKVTGTKTSTHMLKHLVTLHPALTQFQRHTFRVTL